MPCALEQVTLRVEDRPCALEQATLRIEDRADAMRSQATLRIEDRADAMRSQVTLAGGCRCITYVACCELCCQRGPTKYASVNQPRGPIHAL